MFPPTHTHTRTTHPTLGSLTIPVGEKDLLKFTFRRCVQKTFKCSVLVPTFSVTDMAACGAEDVASFYKGFLWGAINEKPRNGRKAVWLTGVELS